MNQPRFLNRNDAGEYLKSKFGFGAAATLARLASQGGGPKFRRFGNGRTVYAPDDLDAWAMTQIGEAVSSTSEITPERGRAGPGRPRKPAAQKAGAATKAA